MNIIRFRTAILLFSSIHTFAQHIPTRDEVSIDYSGFTHYAYPLNAMNTILLKIENHTDDTLYLFEGGIVVDVYKGKTKLESCEEIRNRQYREGVGCLFHFYLKDNPTKTLAERRMEMERDSLFIVLKRNYIERLLVDQGYDVSEVKTKRRWRDDLLPFVVLMPRAIVIYELLYCDPRFDRTCKVYASYKGNHILSMFLKK